MSCFDLYYHVGVCDRDDDGVHRCRRFEADRRVLPPGTRCTRSDVCAGGASCPIAGVCPSDCNDTDGERVCAYTTCNEATGECGFPQECVDG